MLGELPYQDFHSRPYVYRCVLRSKKDKLTFYNVLWRCNDSFDAEYRQAVIRFQKRLILRATSIEKPGWASRTLPRKPNTRANLSCYAIIVPERGYRDWYGSSRFCESTAGPRIAMI